MFITALFTIAKKNEQTRCPSTHKWKNKIWHIHMYLFPRAAITNYHKLVSLNKGSLFSHNAATRSLKLRHQQATLSPKSQWENPSLPLPAWWLQACLGFLGNIVPISVSVFTEPFPFLCLIFFCLL